MDIDGDGDLDMIGLSGGDHFKVYLNTNGQGAFQYNGSPGPLPWNVAHFDLGDLDGDGDLDIVFITTGSHHVRMLNNSGGTFGPPVIAGTLGSEPRVLRCADLTGDGLPEIVVSLASGNSAAVSWLPNLGGTFGTPVGLTGLFTGDASAYLLAGDMDLDGHADLVVFDPNGPVLVLRNTAGDATAWQPETILWWAPQPFDRPRLRDLDGDGDLDVVNASNTAVHWARNPTVQSGWGGFTTRTIAEEGQAGRGAFGTTSCGTGQALVCVPSEENAPVHWQQWSPVLDDLTPPKALPAIPRCDQLLLADLDGDGYDDLVASGSDGIQWYAFIAPAPTTSMQVPALDTLCISGGPVDLPESTPAGGTWSGPGVSDNTLQRWAFGSTGSYPLGCTLYEEAGCPVSVATPVRLITAPQVDPPLAGVICNGTPPIQLTSAPANTSWSGVPPNGVLDPATFAGGMIACAYTDATGETCVSLLGPFQVWNTVPAQVAPLPPLCVNSGEQVVQPAIAPVNGVSWVGPIMSWGPEGAVFDPAQGAGIYEVVMLVSPMGPGQCGNSDTLLITVSDEIPAITVPPSMASCAFGPELPLAGATPEGGVWEGPGVEGAVLYPASAGAGTHVLTYSFLAPNGCGNASSTTVTLYNEATIAWNSPDLIFCPGDPVAQFSAVPAGGAWGAPINAGGLFNASTTAPGSYPVSYTWTGASGCVLTHAPATIDLWSPTPVSIVSVPSLCLEDPPFTISGSHEGVWSGAVSGTGNSIVIDPGALGEGTWPVVLTATEPGFCTANAVALVVVRACAGIAEQGPLAGAAIAPNPFQQEAWLLVDGHGPIIVDVLDAAGRSIATRNGVLAGPSRLLLPLHDLHNGTYLVRLTHAGQVRHLRVVKAA
jgi:hypothetical protein